VIGLRSANHGIALGEGAQLPRHAGLEFARDGMRGLSFIDFFLRFALHEERDGRALPRR
jgi:hypothetical protein